MALRDRLAFAMLLFGSVAVGGQTIRGEVVDSADRLPVAGVVVLLLDGSSAVVARSLTNERGEFRLPAARAGMYRLRTLRIGFRPALSDEIALNSGQELDRRITVSGVPFSLDTVRVESRSGTCRLNADSALVTYAIWEQARTALTATDLSSRIRNTEATTVTYERFLDPRSKRLRRQESRISTGASARPWVSISADSLHRAGYVAQSGEWLVFNAPDLDVLQSDRFLDDHCFRVVEAKDSAQVGLAFEPTRDRSRIPEIRGTIWLDRATSELRRMEFLYTNISREHQDGRAGGDLEFARMRHGAWAISRWNIRMPLLVKNRFPPQPDLVPSIEPALRVFELKVAGGELVTMTRLRDTQWARAPLIFAGMVRDSSTGRPIAGARVSLQGTSAQAVSDAAGNFALRGVLPGDYTLRVRTAALDSLAVAWEAPLAFTDGGNAYVARIPTASEMRRQFCPHETGDARTLLVGQVRIVGDTAPRRDVGVFVDWTDFSVQRGAGVTIRKTAQSLAARTDARGAYHICGVPGNTRIAIQAELENAAPVLLSVPPNTRFMRADILAGVDSTSAVVAAAAGEEGALFSGVVTNDARNQPVSGADVALPALGLSARTSAEGSFVIRDVPAGAYQVTVRQLGYAPLEALITFAANDTIARTFTLRTAQLLDSVVVAARRPTLPGFEARRKIGIGHFITRDDLAKSENQRMSDLLTRVGGLRILRGTGGSQAWVAAGRGALSKYMPDAASRAMGAEPDCYVDVWLDGVRVYAGGQDMLWDVNSMVPGMLEAVEYYAGPAQIPPDYTRANQDCGVLVLWTRRGK